MKNRPLTLLTCAYQKLVQLAGPIVLSTLLLVIRIVWGLGFFHAGWGKLSHIEKPIAFFTELGIPAPTFNAWMVGFVECFGGLFLLMGLGSRAVAAALSINMLVALLTADRDSLTKLFTDADPSALFAAAPFWFLTTSLLVLALGPGWISIDGLLRFIGLHQFASSNRCNSCGCSHPADPKC